MRNFSCPFPLESNWGKGRVNAQWWIQQGILGGGVATVHVGEEPSRSLSRHPPPPCSAVNQDLQGCEPMHVFLASSRIRTLNPWVPRIAYSFGNILVGKFGVGKRYFPCIACKVFSLCRQETNINGLERLLNSLLTFCKSVAADCRGQLCQLGEDLIPALLPVWSKPYPHVKVLF